MGIGTALAIGSVASALTGKDSADKNRSLSKKQYKQTRNDLAPYREAGVNALNQYTDGIGGYNRNLPQFSQADYTPGGDFNFNLEADPGYKFALEEAMNQINRGMASQGGFNSGNRLTALTDRATGLASTYANDAFNRQFAADRENYGRGITDYGIRDSRSKDLFNIASGQEKDLYGREQNYLTRLGNLAGAGQNAAVQTGGFGAQNVANQTNANQFQANTLNNAVQGGISNYLLYDYLNNPPGVG